MICKWVESSKITYNYSITSVWFLEKKLLFSGIKDAKNLSAFHILWNDYWIKWILIHKNFVAFKFEFISEKVYKYKRFQISFFYFRYVWLDMDENTHERKLQCN